MKRSITALALLVSLALPMAALAQYYNPAGAMITGTIQQELRSKTAQDGDGFTMVTSGGSTIYGHLSQVDRANIGRKAHLKLNFDRIRFPDGSSARIHATLVSVQSHKQTNYTRAAGTALGGLIAGNILGKAIGVGIGGAVGLVGGALLAANTASDIDIPAGAQAQIQLTRPLSSGHPQAR